MSSCPCVETAQSRTISGARSATPSTYRPNVCEVLPVIAELEGDAEIVSAKQSDDILQLVFRRRRDPQLVSLDAGLYLLQLLILEELDDIPRRVAGNSLLQCYHPPYARTAGRFDIAELQVLDGHVPPHHPGLKDIPQRIDFHLIFGRERQRAFGFVEVDRGGRPLEIVALRDLFSGLIDGIVHLLEVNSGGDIKR